MPLTLKEIIDLQNIRGIGEDDLSYTIERAPNRFSNMIIDPVKTAFNFGIGALENVPFLGSVVSGIGSTFTPGPSDRFSNQFSIGANPQLTQTYGDNRIGNMPGQDPYGINTISAFGNYPAYAYDTVATLRKNQDLTPFQQDKLNFYQNVIDKNNQRITDQFGTFKVQEYEQDTNGGSTTVEEDYGVNMGGPAYDY